MLSGRNNSGFRIQRARSNWWWQWGIGLVAISACLYGGLGVSSWYDIKNGGVPLSAVTAVSSPDKPSEQPVPPDYSVPAGQPKSISLPSIKSQGFIQKVGVDTTNQLVAPGNIHMAGWYTGSVLPGEPGLSIIDGHVSGVYEKGVFYNLSKLKPNDTFTVSYGDDSVRTFRVAKVEVVPLDQASKALFSRDESIESQLTIVSCGGTYIPSTKTYDKRVIVTSEAIKL